MGDIVPEKKERFSFQSLPGNTRPTNEPKQVVRTCTLVNTVHTKHYSMSSDQDDDSVLHDGTHSVYQVVACRTSQAEREGRVIRIDQEEDEEDNNGRPLDPYRFLDRRVYKEFPPHGWFFGTIKEILENVEEEDVDYRVVYDDDDAEDLAWDDLKVLLEQWERNKSGDKVWLEKQAEKQSKQRKRKTTTTAAPTNVAAPHTPVKVKLEQTGSTATAVTPSPIKKPRPPPPPFVASDYFKKNSIDIVWIREMAQWLENEQVSQSNGRTVLQKVTKLAKGEGVDYTKHWPTHAVFLKNIKVDLNFRFDLMGQLARQYEKIFGKDKSNGWLLKHPIKKMLLYQQHLGITPSVDFTQLPAFVSHV